MVNFAKKYLDDGVEALKSHRIQRKHRSHKMAMTVGVSRRENRSGWGYNKRRSLNELG